MVLQVTIFPTVGPGVGVTFLHPYTGTNTLTLLEGQCDFPQSHQEYPRFTLSWVPVTICVYLRVAVHAQAYTH